MFQLTVHIKNTVTFLYTSYTICDRYVIHWINLINNLLYQPPYQLQCYIIRNNNTDFVENLIPDFLRKQLSNTSLYVSVKTNHCFYLNDKHKVMHTNNQINKLVCVLFVPCT